MFEPANDMNLKSPNEQQPQNNQIVSDWIWLKLYERVVCSVTSTKADGAKDLQQPGLSQHTGD